MCEKDGHRRAFGAAKNETDGRQLVWEEGGDLQHSWGVDSFGSI